MNKVTIVCLVDDQEQSLRELRKMGSVHVVPCVETSSASVDDLRRERDELGQVLYHLNGLKPKGEGASAASEASTNIRQDVDGADCRRECVELLARQRRLSERLARLDQEIARLEPWGQFDPATLERLEERGFHTALVVHTASQHGRNWLAQYADEGADEIQEFPVTVRNGQSYALLVSTRDLSELALPRANFPEGCDLSALQFERGELLRERAKCEQKLTFHAEKNLPLLQDEARRLENELRFAQTRDGMGTASGRLTYLQGYVPAVQLDDLRNQAYRNGWAIRYEEVTPEDTDVPTKLRLPKTFRMAETLLDFIGVLPGYNEVDVSVSVMIFLSLFCGLLVGDAGYGLLFSGLTAYGLWKAVKKGDDAMKQAMQLLLGMSLCTLLWGFLTGNWLGLRWGGVPWFQDDSNTQLFCFFLAALHLSLAHLWRAVLAKGLRARLGDVGWAIFLWANFFTIKALLIDHSFENFTFPKYLYLVGTVLILTCGINWANAGDVIYSPFTFINSLSDILSYIRLYAVGLSSIYIATAFNDMGAMLWHGRPYLLPVGLLVILAGHLLNVAMAMMSVLVHGIRLNTLEFSGHIGVEWGGRKYRPFRENES